jgi:hypothetical protein
MHLAWEASSAAAGAMMLFGRAAEALKELSANIPRPPGMS